MAKEKDKQAETRTEAPKFIVQPGCSIIRGNSVKFVAGGAVTLEELGGDEGYLKLLVDRNTLKLETAEQKSARKKAEAEARAKAEKSAAEKRKKKGK